MLEILVILYIIANIIMFFYIGFNGKLFENGFCVKHLMVAILFLPATVYTLVIVAIGGTVLAIAQGVIKLIKKLFGTDFLNKRLF